MSPKNGIVKNALQNTSRKMSGVLDTYLQEKNPYKKTTRRAGKSRRNLGRNQAQKLDDLPTKPKKNIIIIIIIIIKEKKYVV